jgi:hypothetical protein
LSSNEQQTLVLLRHNSIVACLSRFLRLQQLPHGANILQYVVLCYVLLHDVTLLSHVLVTKMGFRLTVGFINRLPGVFTINYNTVTKLHFYKALRPSLFSIFALVFTIHFLATAL